MKVENPFLQPMQPWPDLASYARMVRLPKSGVELFFYDTGNLDAPTVLLVHGLGDEADTWRYILPSLAETQRVLAPDLPGFGRSDKPRRNYSIAFYTSVLFELMDVLQIEKAQWVGHSMGAVIVQSAALLQPQRVSQLVLISGGLAANATRLSWRTLLFLIPRLGEWVYNGLRKDAQKAYRSLLSYYRSLQDFAQQERDFLFLRVNQRVWSDGQRDAFLSALRSLAAWLPGQQKTLPDRLAGFRIPTVIIWGDADQVNPVGNGRALSALMQSARLQIVPLGGHNLHQEDPKLVLKMME